MVMALVGGRWERIVDDLPRGYRRPKRCIDGEEKEMSVIKRVSKCEVWCKSMERDILQLD